MASLSFFESMSAKAISGANTETASADTSSSKANTESISDKIKKASTKADSSKIEKAGAFSKCFRGIGFRLGYAQPLTVYDFRVISLYLIGMYINSAD